MKKSRLAILVFIVVLVLSVGLVACTNTNEGNTDQGNGDNIQEEQTPIMHKVTYMNDGVVFKTEEYEEGKEITLPTPIKEGFSFDGWYDVDNTNNNGTEFVNDIMPNNDIILYAVWTTKDATELSYKYNTAKGTLSVSKSLGINQNVVIPSVYKNIPVTGIDDMAFENDAVVKTVQIPNSITTIGKSAFSGCNSLVDISLPDSITSIGDSAFFGCDSLQSFYLPSSVTQIGIAIIANCSNMVTVEVAKNNKSFYSKNNCIIDKNSNILVDGCINSVIPADIETIGDYAFYACQCMQNINIPSNIKNIGDYAFYNCIAVSELILPEGVETIGSNAFANCKFNKISLPKTLLTIAKDSFYNCTLINDATMPTIAISCIKKNNLQKVVINGGTKIDNWAFYSLNNLISVTIMDGVTEIGENAFNDCNNLSIVKLPNTLQTIGMQAFNKCVWIQNITIPSSVKTIGSNAFDLCNNLIKVNVDDIVAFSKINFANSGANPLSIAKNLYKNDALVTEITIPSDVTINPYAFAKCQNITSANIPTSAILHIPNYTIKTLVINGGDVIQYNAYQNCLSLESVTILEGVTTIKEGAFYGCSYLKNVKLPNTLTTIERLAFNGCEGLTEITLPISIATIGSDGFANCNNITKVNVPNLLDFCKIDFANGRSNPLFIAKNLYVNDILVTEITIPKTIDIINSYALKYCDNIVKATVPANLFMYIPKDKLENIVFDGGNSLITEINNLPNLKTVTVEEGIGSIDRLIFNHCQNLEEIYLPNSLSNVGENIISYCPKATIYCKRASMSTAWNNNWNNTNKSPVVWDYAGEKGTSVDGFNWALLNNGNLSITGYSGLETTVTFPSLIDGKKVEEICENAFAKNRNGFIKIVVDGIDKLESNAFKGSEYLTDVELINVKKIGLTVFNGCVRLQNIILPKSLTQIEKYNFYGCNALSNINYEGTIAEFNNLIYASGEFWYKDVNTNVVHCSNGDYKFR